MKMKSLVFLFITLVSFGSLAQTPEQVGTSQKIGYADWEYVFSKMPESKQIDTQMKTHSSQLEAQLKAKYTEYQTKLKDYQDKASTMLDAVRKDKETELTQLQENIQKFQQDAQSSISKKQSDLMGPVFDKIGKAIEDVAKENGYIFIINPQLVGGGDILLYSDEKYNISDLVLKKLGVAPVASNVQPK
jgi:outer membrane protein